MEINSTFQHNNSINNNTKEKIYKIVQKQNNLKIFKISHCEYLLNNILSSLEFQKNSLIYIEFKYINFNNVSFKNFINFYNLKYLKFENCKGFISLDQFEILNHVSFDLKELILVGNLKIPVIENISKFCSNNLLNNLEIDIDYYYIDLLVFPYFKNLRIRILDIINYSYYDIDDLLLFNNNNNNNNNLPIINFKEFSIRFHNFHSLHFKKFLENCNDCLEIINFDNFIDLEFLLIILNYIERRCNNNLKFLGINNLENIILNDEEKKLLNQFKSKGIKILDFYSNYQYDFIF